MIKKNEFFLKNRQINTNPEMMKNLPKIDNKSKYIGVESSIFSDVS
jgi:hypothetical protein